MKPLAPQAGPEAEANITLATKARQVEAWLAGLPLGDPQGNARALAEYLAAHDRPEVPAGLRKHLLDLLGEPVRRTLAVLTKRLRGEPLPMTARQLEPIGRAIDLLTAVADCNQRLLLEGGERVRPLFGGGQSAGHYSACLHARLAIMEICHLSHRQLPDGFWLATHGIGHRLLQSGLADMPDPGRPDTRLGALYLALLLEATADPYHLTEQERTWAVDIVVRHGALAMVGPAAASGPGGVFAIRVQRDRPPYPLSWQRGSVPDCDLVLDTGPLVRKLAHILSQLERGRAPGQDIAAVRHPGYKPLLQRLKLTWGGSAQRLAARHRPAQAMPRALLVGLDAVHRYLSGAADLPTWPAQLVNDSLGGMALRVARPEFRFGIGSLVCVGDQAGQGRRELGLVRWFKTGPDGGLDFGIKYRHGRPVPVLWQGAGDAQAVPCLLMEPEPRQPAGARHLIVPAQALGRETRLLVRHDGGEMGIDLSGRIEATPELEIYRCAVATG